MKGSHHESALIEANQKLHTITFAFMRMCEYALLDSLSVVSDILIQTSLTDTELSPFLIYILKNNQNENGIYFQGDFSMLISGKMLCLHFMIEVKSPNM